MNISEVRTTQPSVVLGFEVNGEQFEIIIGVKTLPQVAAVSNPVPVSAEAKPARKKPGPKPGMKRHLVKKVKAEALGPNGEHQPEQVA